MKNTGTIPCSCGAGIAEGPTGVCAGRLSYSACRIGPSASYCACQIGPSVSYLGCDPLWHSGQRVLHCRRTDSGLRAQSGVRGAIAWVLLGRSRRPGRACCAVAQRRSMDSASLKPMGYTWSCFACRIGHGTPIWQPCIGSTFQVMHCTGRCRPCAPGPPAVERGWLGYSSGGAEAQRRLAACPWLRSRRRGADKGTSAPMLGVNAPNFFPVAACCGCSCAVTELPNPVAQPQA
jgi:hypothetical protein